MSGHEIASGATGPIMRGPIEGRIIEELPTPGRFGWAEVNGVQFAVTSVDLKLGAVIFECTLMRPARYAFTVRPGAPAKIYGRDSELIADFAVPGITHTATVCEVRPGDMVTIYLPIRFGEIGGRTEADQRYYDNMAVNYGDGR